MSITVEEKLHRARVGLIIDHPFFGSLVMRLKLIQNNEIETMCTDGCTIKYNDSFVEEKTPQELKGVLAHEVLHCASGHHTRRDNRNFKPWNKACDYAINPIIKGAGLTLPAGHLDNPSYSDKAAEEIYNIIKDTNENGEGEGEDPGGTGSVTDPKGEEGQPLSESDTKQLEQDWKIAAKQALQQSKAMGKMPAGMDRFIDEVLRPRVAWELILQQFVQTTAKTDYSLSPPNRRFVHQGLYLPSLKSEEISDLYIFDDVSGSIGQKEINSFQAEIQSIMDSFNPRITVFYFDTQVNGYDVFEPGEQVIFKNCKGGGGTSFVPIFEEVEKLNLQPECVIIFTDLYGNFPDQEPPYPTLWINTDGDRRTAPFGLTVPME